MQNEARKHILNSIFQTCNGCGLCSDECDVLNEIYPATPVDIAGQVLDGTIDETTRSFLLRCALCGLCANLCPDNLDIPKMVTAARSILVDKGMTDTEIYRIMWVDHDWNAITLYRDTYQLDFNHLVKEKCDTLFMPGCSLANEAPQLVSDTVRWLSEYTEGSAGATLMCCGMPLFEMGLTDRGKKLQEVFWQKVKKAGAKRLVIACPNCLHQVVARGLEEGVEVVSLLEFMARAGLRAPATGLERVTIHDSCPGRGTEMGLWARQILDNYEIIEMEHNQQNAICCGSGGAVAMVDHELCLKRANRRAQEFVDTQADACITYCMSCCNTFTQVISGNKIKHILELVFNRFIDHSEYQAKLQAMWQGEWGAYNDYRLQNSQMLGEYIENE